MNRAAGILLPISSLPSKYGFGCFSQDAYDFVDWLREAGQTYWQILPLYPTSFGDSPYQSFSTFAGNPYFISLEALIDEGVLTREECDSADFGVTAGAVVYEKLYRARYPLLRRAYERSDIAQNPEYLRFLEENSGWLPDYALFMAVKGRFDGAPWTQWAEDIRLRWGFAMDYYRRELYWSFISLVLRSSAKICVIPMQDYLGLDNHSRMNKPSTVGTNWLWRMTETDLTADLQKRIRSTITRYGRDQLPICSGPVSVGMPAAAQG